MILYHKTAKKTTKPSEEALSQRASDQRATGPHSFVGADVVRRREARVDFNKIDGNQASCLMHTLANKVSLAQRQPTSNRCAGRWCPHGVKRVHVKRQVNGRVRADVGQRHLHDTTNSVSGGCQSVSAVSSTSRDHIPVDVKHAERLDPVLPQDTLLPCINVPQPDVYELLHANHVIFLQPSEEVLVLLSRQPS